MEELKLIKMSDERYLEYHLHIRDYMKNFRVDENRLHNPVEILGFDKPGFYVGAEAVFFKNSSLVIVFRFYEGRWTRLWCGDESDCFTNDIYHGQVRIQDRFFYFSEFLNFARS